MATLRGTTWTIAPANPGQFITSTIAFNNDGTAALTVPAGPLPPVSFNGSFVEGQTQIQEEQGVFSVNLENAALGSFAGAGAHLEGAGSGWLYGNSAVPGTGGIFSITIVAAFTMTRNPGV